MEEETAGRAARFNASRPLEGEILEARDRTIDARECLRHHHGEIVDRNVELTITHGQEQITPARGSESLADGGEPVQQRRSGGTLELRSFVARCVIA